jgi:hypothetical protein
MNTIGKTTPHYVRCIKPNPQKKPALFDKPQVLHQLRCGGVLESVPTHAHTHSRSARSRLGTHTTHRPGAHQHGRLPRSPQLRPVLQAVPIIY